MSGTMSSMYEKQIRMQTGKAGLIITSNRHSPSSTFKLRTEPLEGVAQMVGAVSASGTYKLSETQTQTSKTKSEKFLLRGFDMDELEQLNPINFSQLAVGSSFEGNKDRKSVV